MGSRTRNHVKDGEGGPTSCPSTSARAPVQKKTKKSKTIDEFSREEFLRMQIQEIEKDIELAREDGKGLTALSHLRRQLHALRDALDQEIERQAELKTSDPVAAMTDEELLAEEREALASLPVHLVEDLARLVLERLGRSAAERLVREMA